MARAERKELIQRLQAARGGRLLITYITSTRPGFDMAMADDVLRWMFDHLEGARDVAQQGVDLFIHSNGGHGTVPWRIVNLVREYTKHFAVLVPHKAFSAATLLALGADEIVMHRMGCLGPIDPSVANQFNPTNPANPGQQLAISVEDVTAYFKLVKDEVGITHEDELVQALSALTDKVHPLALGNVQRSHHQSRMMATKLLKKHMAPDRSHDIEQIVENLKSNLFFHGHPINRQEAVADLNLKVVAAPVNVEQLMWELYLSYEDELHMTVPFNLLHELDSRATKGAAAPITTADILHQLQTMAKAGLGLGTLPEKQLVDLAAAMVPHVQGAAAAPGKVRIDNLPGVYVESAARCDVFLTDLDLEKATINTGAGPQDVVKQEVVWQRWEIEP